MSDMACFDRYRRTLNAPNRVHLIGSAISSDAMGKRQLLDFDRAAPFPEL